MHNSMSSRCTGVYSSQVLFCFVNITSKRGGCWGAASPRLGSAFLLLLTVLRYFSTGQPLLKSWVHRFGRARKKKCSPEICFCGFLKIESHEKQALQLCHPGAVGKSHSAPRRNSTHKTHLWRGRKVDSSKKSLGAQLQRFRLYPVRSIRQSETSAAVGWKFGRTTWKRTQNKFDFTAKLIPGISAN